MGNRSDCCGRGTALEGDKTTTGAECIASMSNDTGHGLRGAALGIKPSPVRNVVRQRLSYPVNPVIPIMVKW